MQSEEPWPLPPNFLLGQVARSDEKQERLLQRRERSAPSEQYTHWRGKIATKRSWSRKGNQEHFRITLCTVILRADPSASASMPVCPYQSCPLSGCCFSCKSCWMTSNPAFSVTCNCAPLQQVLLCCNLVFSNYSSTNLLWVLGDAGWESPVPGLKKNNRVQALFKMQLIVSTVLSPAWGLNVRAKLAVATRDEPWHF